MSATNCPYVSCDVVASLDADDASWWGPPDVEVAVGASVAVMLMRDHGLRIYFGSPGPPHLISGLIDKMRETF